ncbi:MAG: hypothetical protein WDO24_23000 [Pseudomonadota bacterium]
MPQFPDLLYMDPGWHLHRAFYGNIERFLAPGGMVLLLENFQGSSPSVFQGMITDAGLEIVYCRPHAGLSLLFPRLDPPVGDRQLGRALPKAGRLGFQPRPAQEFRDLSHVRDARSRPF